MRDYISAASTKGGFSICPLVFLIGLNLALFLHELPLERFPLPISDCGRFFEILSFLPLADDTFLFNHSLESLKCFLKWFAFVYSDLSDRNHLPLLVLIKEFAGIGRICQVRA